MLDTSSFFSESFYLSDNPGVAAAINAGILPNGLEHFNSFGRSEGRDPSLLFDSDFYLQQNPDVADLINSGAFPSAFEHFDAVGQFEGRDPSRLFDTSFYLDSNLDVAATVAQIDSLTGFKHYTETGQFEDRSPSQLFNNGFYLQQDPDLAAAIEEIDSLTGIRHFLDFGIAENRSPSIVFDNNIYLQQNPGVADALNNGQLGSAFEHYLNFGIAEQRISSPLAFDPATIYVSNNGTDNAGTVDRVNGAFGEPSTRFAPGNNQGVELDVLGNLYQAGDATVGSIRIISQPQTEQEGDSFNPLFDREIVGEQTGLTNPKGIAIALEAGYIIAADFGSGDLKVFGTSVAGDVPPVAITDLPANPWDVVYDANADSLFVALTDGTLGVFDNYIAGNFGAGGVSRLVTLVDESGMEVSTNLHGIVYDPSRNQLVVTDVGAATAEQSPAFNSDGRIYVLDNASTIDGNVVPSRTIEGPAAQLGNPVDLILNGSDVRVAEKAGDKLLVFQDIFTGPSGNIAPDLTVAQTKPESLVAEVNRAIAPDVTDIEFTGGASVSLVTTSNPPEANDFVAKLTRGLQAQTTFDTSNGVATVENITFDRSGDGFLTFDDGDNTNGGILVVNRLAETRNGGGLSVSRDRIIAGSNTGLVSPKGLDVADDLGLVFVAENNASTPGILAFSTQGEGDLPPVFSTTDLGGRRPWDVDYEPSSDRLFVAATDGSVLIYDNYAANSGAGGPSRTISPFDPSGTNPISVNLHGIIYVESSDTLLLSDVGSAMDPNDGQLFVIDNVSSASGNTPVRTQIGGDNTLLGNPVDITFDGNSLYVAEKSNDAILRYDNILDRSGVLNIAASEAAIRNKPESVALTPLPVA
ncbi:MAG: hypothetical protein SXA11_13485 [Cyanobacteriota bacterium]|nr:hypothetical protein [Cyanobacteriota bacterium]